jgi:[protein-PII] uridylyltransferase
LLGASIWRAATSSTRIHHAAGVAVDNFLVQDPLGRPLNEDNQIKRLKIAIADALANKVKLQPSSPRDRWPGRVPKRSRSTPSSFSTTRPRSLHRDRGRRLDRPALLSSLARALFEARLIVYSAHIATYGERAVDTFYVTDILGEKITSESRLRSIERRLIEGAQNRRSRSRHDRACAFDMLPFPCAGVS